MSLPIPPWQKGKSPKGDGVVLEVWLCRAPSGQLYALHRPQSQEDEQVLLSWPTGGQEQAAIGLLLEAVKREAILDILLKESQSPGWAQDLLQKEGAGQTDILQDLSARLLQLFGKTIRDVAPGAFKDALQALNPEPPASMPPASTPSGGTHPGCS